MQDKLIGNENNILFYNDEEGNIKVEVLKKLKILISWLVNKNLAFYLNV